MTQITMQISDDLKKELDKRKIFEDETYEEVIWGILEEKMELNDKTKREIAKSVTEIKNGKVKSFEKIKMKIENKY